MQPKRLLHKLLELATATNRLLRKLLEFVTATQTASSLELLELSYCSQRQVFEEYVSSTRVPLNLTKIRFLCSSVLFLSSIWIYVELWTDSLLQGKALDFLMSFSLYRFFYERMWFFTVVFSLGSICCSLSCKWFESPFIVGFQICSLKRDKFEFRMFFCSCHTCSCLVIVVECFFAVAIPDFLGFLELLAPNLGLN